MAIEEFLEESEEAIEDLKRYFRNNPKGRLGTEEHIRFITDKFITLVKSAEEVIRKNSISDFLLQKFDLLATKEDVKQLLVAQSDKNLEAIQEVKQTICDLEKPPLLGVEGSQGTTALSYRDILQRDLNSLKNTQSEKESSLPTYTVLVYNDNKESTSEETKTLLTNSFDQRLHKVPVKRIRKINKGGIAVDFPIREEAEYFQEQLDKIEGLKARNARRRLPLMKVTSVPNSVTKEDLLEYLLEQNIFSQKYTMEEFKKVLNIRFSIKQRNDEFLSWVLEMSPEVRAMTKKQGYFYVQWKTCKVYDFFPVRQCYKCLAFGHLAASCPSPKKVCSHCGDDHLFKTCTKKSEKPKCANCLRSGLDKHEHNTLDKECPLYIKAKALYIKTADYLP
ncbi:uncharacterized protein LOC111633522 [Centruroides sculpturatus]|uniref:uncharacterized protein LOC111627701 n=1 Tax=Centruroides sculpturatus TaxID=218467 RepID=UPI000C6E562C|nr:uncharacterized protein LOC111627701 [Centruroides sculpturatus]XP_023233874.1 uncharacterized protein LOC111633522 [Centruroides sculpturatus]